MLRRETAHQLSAMGETAHQLSAMGAMGGMGDVSTVGNAAVFSTLLSEIDAASDVGTHGKTSAITSASVGVSTGSAPSARAQGKAGAVQVARPRTPSWQIPRLPNIGANVCNARLDPRLDVGLRSVLRAPVYIQCAKQKLWCVVGALP